MVKRIPYASRKKVKRLPGEAKLILSMAKKSFPIQEYKMLENTFVGVNELSKSKKLKPVLNEKMYYGGELNFFGSYNYINQIGLYNPSEIPLDIIEKMSRDPTIALGTAIIKHTVSGLNKRVDCEDEKQGKIIFNIINKVYNQTTNSLTDAVKIGFAGGEKCWDYKRILIKDFDENGNKKTIVDDYFYVLDKIKFPNPKTIRIRVDKKGNFLGFTQISPLDASYIKVNSNKTVLYSHNMQWGNWFGLSRYVNIYPAWYWSTVLNQFALKYYERLGQPLTKVKAPPGTSTNANHEKVDNLTYALQIGQGAISNSVVAIPSVFDKNSQKPLWDIEYVGDVPRGNMFIDILNHFDTMKLRGLFIPDRLGLASDGSPHSASGASAGDTLDVFIMTEQALAGDLECVWNEQIIPDIQRNNFEEDEIVEAKLVIEKLDYSKKLLLKDMLLRMIMTEAGAMRDGNIPKHLPSLTKICQMLDIPVEKFNEIFDEVKQASQLEKGNGNNPIDTKNKQDKNNADRSTDRKTRSGKERSVREKK